MSMNFSCDNSGNRIPAHPQAANPIAASGQTLSNADTNNHEATVVGGGIYAFTAQVTGGFKLGILTTATAANIIWACPLGKTIIIKMPEGETTLHYSGDTNSAVGYLRRLS